MMRFHACWRDLFACYIAVIVNRTWLAEMMRFNACWRDLFACYIAVIVNRTWLAEMMRFNAYWGDLIFIIRTDSWTSRDPFGYQIRSRIIATYRNIQIFIHEENIVVDERSICGKDLATFCDLWDEHSIYIRNELIHN